MIVIIILLKNQPSVMEKVIFSVVSLVAGALGGYGYGYKRNGRVNIVSHNSHFSHVILLSEI